MASLKKVKKVLPMPPESHRSQRDTTGWNPLLLAVYLKQVDIVNFLLNEAMLSVKLCGRDP